MFRNNQKLSNFISFSGKYNFKSDPELPGSGSTTLFFSGYFTEPFNSFCHKVHYREGVIFFVMC